MRHAVLRSIHHLFVSSNRIKDQLVACDFLSLLCNTMGAILIAASRADDLFVSDSSEADIEEPFEINEALAREMEALVTVLDDYFALMKATVLHGLLHLKKGFTYLDEALACIGLLSNQLPSATLYEVCFF